LPHSRLEHPEHNAETIITVGIETEVVFLRALRNAGVREAIHILSALNAWPRSAIHDPRPTIRLHDLHVLVLVPKRLEQCFRLILERQQLADGIVNS
jgi:hypothetical protein